MKNILITETDRIGDVILTLPVFKSIKLFNKNIKITALVRTYTKDIFHNFPYVDDVLSFTNLNNKENIMDLFIKIKNRNFDTALILHPEFKLAKILRKAGINKRFSYGWKWYQFLFSKVLIQHRSKNLKHQLEYNLDLLKFLFINKFNTDIKLIPYNQDLKLIRNILKNKNLLNKILIGIHPGSGHSSLNLPPHKYVELINNIKKKFKKLEIVLTGNENDLPVINYILTHTQVSINAMPHTLSLSNLIALISQTTVFISNSTGPLHIASSLHIPTVAFFSPVFIHSPVRWGPYWGKKLIIQPEVRCTYKWNCKNNTCSSYNCFNNIQFNQVLDYIKNLI